MMSEALDEYLDQVTLDVLAATSSECTSVCVDKNKPTEFHPDDIYNSREDDQIYFYGKILTLEDKDDIVKRMFKKEYWPDRLKEKECHEKVILKKG